jgi:histidinol-phosphate phosphatase family protein
VVEPGRERAAAILLDRDGTLIIDVPCNGDPAKVEPVPGARAALDRVRAAGVPMAIVSNQSGIARGLVTMEQVRAVHRRIEELVGPIGPLLVCPHLPDQGCSCRKPMPGLVERAAQTLDVPAERCVLIGDIGPDVEAAIAAGATPILVPTEITRREEIDSAPEVASSLDEAVRLALGER